MSIRRPAGPAIVAAEGLCFAGKTTLTRALARRLGAGVVSEYADLAPLPSFPPGSRAAARTALLQFLAIEAGRAWTARQMGGPLVLYDRCPLTLIAHEHAMAAAGVPADAPAAADWFSQAVACGALIAPDAYLYLTVPDRDFADRQARRGPLPTHLVSPRTRAAITAVYTAYFAAAGPGRVLELDGSDDLGQLADRAAAFIEGLPRCGSSPVPPWSVLVAAAAAGVPR